MDRTIVAPRQTAARAPLLINAAYARLWVGSSISSLGDSLFDTTLILWIATILARSQTWGPLAVSGLLLAVAVPTVVAGPLAGVFVDRWDARRLMLRVDALRALLVALLLPLSGLLPAPLNGAALPAGLQLGLIYAVVALASTCAQFFGPARTALLSDIVPGTLRGRAAGLSQTSSYLALVIGPTIAASLLFGAGVGWALALNAGSFLCSFAAIVGLQVPPRQPAAPPDSSAGSYLRELREGWRFFLGSRVLCAITLGAALAMLGAGAMNALGVFFLTGNLHADARLLGPLDAAMALGSIVGAAGGAFLAERAGLARTFWLSTVLTGLLMLAYARMTQFAPALAIAFLAGIPMALLNVALTPLVLRATPRAYIGRVIAVLMPAVSLASMVSIALAGTLSSSVLRGFHRSVLGLQFGAVDTIFTGAAALIVTGGVVAWWYLREAPSETARDTA